MKQDECIFSLSLEQQHGVGLCTQETGSITACDHATAGSGGAGGDFIAPAGSRDIARLTGLR